MPAALRPTSRRGRAAVDAGRPGGRGSRRGQHGVGFADHRCDAARPGRPARRPVRGVARCDDARRPVLRRGCRKRSRGGAHRCGRVGAVEPRRRHGSRARPPPTPRRARRDRRHGVRPSVRTPRRRRGHRHVGKDHDHLPDRSRSSVGRPIGGADRHGRSADQRRRHPQRADHAGGAGAAGPAGGDGRARRRHRGDGGVQPCADPGARRRHPVRGRRIHQLVP